MSIFPDTWWGWLILGYYVVGCVNGLTALVTRRKWMRPETLARATWYGLLAMVLVAALIWPFEWIGRAVGWWRMERTVREAARRAGLPRRQVTWRWLPPER